MEATVLKKKNVKISKGKLKKTMKNILCRPDPMHWPEISDEHSKCLEEVLKRYQVEIPQFTKLPWSELALIPKTERPKAPKLQKVPGLTFGITSCDKIIKSGECSAILLEAEISPKILVQHIIDSCSSNHIPYLCIKGLKHICRELYGFPTSCLGVQNSLKSLSNKVIEISKEYQKNMKHVSQKNPEIEYVQEKIQMEVEIEKLNKVEDVRKPIKILYRTSKNTRVFTPPAEEPQKKMSSKFVGQDFIELSQQSETQYKHTSYMNMIVKRISSNANRNKKALKYSYYFFLVL